MKQYKLSGITFIVLVLGTSSGFTEPIAIKNHGFEELACASSPNQCNWNDTGSWTTTIPGWDACENETAQPTSGGVWDPTPMSYPDGVPEGNQIAWVHNCFSQVLEETLQSGTTYQLRMEVGSRADDLWFSFNGYTIELLAGQCELVKDSDGVTPAPGSFEPVTLLYNASLNHPCEGQPLQIKLKAPPSANFDDIRLEKDPAAFTCYEISDISFTERQVTVQNAFGEQTFTLVKPNTFCVPSTYIEHTEQ